MAIEIPRCFYCNRLAPELTFTDALGDDQAVCVTCIDAMSGDYEWSVFAKGDDWLVAASDNRQFNATHDKVFSGTYTACWAWAVEHSP